MLGLGKINSLLSDINIISGLKIIKTAVNSILKLAFIEIYRKLLEKRNLFEPFVQDTENAIDGLSDLDWHGLDGLSDLDRRWLDGRGLDLCITNLDFLTNL